MAELKLTDLRRYAILNRTPILYGDAAGRKARVNAKGVVEIPGISGAPPFRVDELLTQAQEFVLEQENPKAPPRRLDREQMAELLSRSTSAASAAVHEKEE